MFGVFFLAQADTSIEFYRPIITIHIFIHDGVWQAFANILHPPQRLVNIIVCVCSMNTPSKLLYSITPLTRFISKNREHLSILQFSSKKLPCLKSLVECAYTPVNRQLAYEIHVFSFCSGGHILNLPS